jgi:hypothetical protein
MAAMPRFSREVAVEGLAVVPRPSVNRAFLVDGLGVVDFEQRRSRATVRERAGEAPDAEAVGGCPAQSKVSHIVQFIICSGLESNIALTVEGLPLSGEPSAVSTRLRTAALYLLAERVAAPNL